MNGLPPYDDLPETVQAAFRGRTMLSKSELAAVLEMDVQTLHRHFANGDISGRFKGVGRINRRIVFTISDVAKYFRTPPKPLAPDLRLTNWRGERVRTSFKIGTMNVQPVKPRRKKP